MDNDKNYKLESVNIRAAENGYTVRCDKRLTDKAEAKQRKDGKGSIESMFKSEEYVAETIKAAMAIVEKELSEYAKEDESKEAKGDDDMKVSSETGLGFR